MLFWPASAHAQLTAPRESVQIEFGPVSLYPSLQIVDAGKDQNVFNDGTEPKEDYTFTIASRALVVTRLGLNQLLSTSTARSSSHCSSTRRCGSCCFAGSPFWSDRHFLYQRE